MSEFSPVLLFLLGALLVAALGLFTWWMDQKRAAALREFCRSTGWSYAASDSSLPARWTCHPFFEGRQRRARNIIRGSVGVAPNIHEFVAFDYSYVTEHSDGDGHNVKTTHRYQIYAIPLPAYFPALQVTPENMLTRVGAGLGGQDIDLESEDFNRRFRVQCPDPKFACDVLTPRTMHALLLQPPLHFRFEGKDLLCWESGVLKTTSLLERTSTLAAVVAGIPSFVWRDYGIVPTAEGLPQ